MYFSVFNLLLPYMLPLVCWCTYGPLKVKPHVGSLHNGVEVVTRQTVAKSDYKLIHHLALKIEVHLPSSQLRAGCSLQGSSKTSPEDSFRELLKE